MNIAKSADPIIGARAEYAIWSVTGVMFCHGLRFDSALSAKMNQRKTGKQV